MNNYKLKAALPFLILAAIAIASLFIKALPNFDEGKYNGADTAWILVATALVFLMTPGLAFFYGGMVNHKNVLSTMMKSVVAAGLVGGLGVAPGANIGPEAAVFEAVHGSAPKYAGLNKANPTALILSGALMLRHLGHPDAAGRLEEALRAVVAEGRSVTYDLGGNAGTSQFADAIIERLAIAPAVVS